MPVVRPRTKSPCPARAGIIKRHLLLPENHVKLIKLGAGVLNQTPLDWDGNRDRIVKAIDEAKERDISVLCLPELCISGYGCEDSFYSPGVHQMAFRVLLEILPSTQGIIASVGLPLLHRGGIYNVAALMANGELLGLVGKQNLAGEGLHYEPRWFKPWPDSVRANYEFEEQVYPVGDLIFNCDGVRIGFEICEDAWVANRPGGELAQQGVDILLNPSASHFAFGKHDVRRQLVLNGSRAFAVSYVYANLLGNEAGRAIYDGDAMIASCGKMLARGDRFSFADFHITSAVVDVDESRMQRARTSSFRPDVEIDPKTRVDCDFQWPPAATECEQARRDAWEASDYLKEEEFTRAISLGLFDYLRKSRSRGFVVSLSGGADSAAVATLSSLAIQMGVDEIGQEACWKKLSHIAAISKCNTQDAIAKLLTCAYQSTRNSSTTTREAARDVAQATHAEFLELDVDSIVQDYIALISNAIDRELAWETDDIALQNIQARVRSPSIWMIANIRNALLLSTSNRSEAAVGYATMDGDTSGGLSPIAGIDKAFLRQWLRWMETTGPDGFGAIPALRSVNVQQPTAELRPLETKQTDEQDLMPYELLDAIECSAIRDKHTPLEVFVEMQKQFPQYEAKQLGAWVERFFQLWCRNQWKRERYAPSFHVDDKNLDPKTWCRFPILSGGYSRELRDLRDHVNAL